MRAPGMRQCCLRQPPSTSQEHLLTDIPSFLYIYVLCSVSRTYHPTVLPTDPPSPWPPLSPCSRIRFKRMVLDGLNGTAPAYLQALVKSHTPAPALRSTTCPLMPGSAKSNQSSNNKILTLLYFCTAIEESAPCRRQDRRDSHQVTSHSGLTCSEFCCCTKPSRSSALGLARRQRAVPTAHNRGNGPTSVQSTNSRFQLNTGPC